MTMELIKNKEECTYNVTNWGEGEEQGSYNETKWEDNTEEKLGILIKWGDNREKWPEKGTILVSSHG